MKRLLFLMLSIVLLSTANAVTIVKVYPYNGVQKCIGYNLDTGDYAADIATAVWYALGDPTYINNLTNNHH